MNRQRIVWIEVTVGAFMLFAFIGAIFLALRVSGLVSIARMESYEIKAHFDNIAGLKVRAPVNVAGVTVGRVVDIQFDPKMFDAVVFMEIDNQYDMLPTDTSATILTSGLLGERYINLEPGADEEVLEDGSEIEFTQPALILEQLVGKFLTRGSQEKNGEETLNGEETVEETVQKGDEKKKAEKKTVEEKKVKNGEEKKEKKAQKEEEENGEEVKEEDKKEEKVKDGEEKKEEKARKKEEKNGEEVKKEDKKEKQVKNGEEKKTKKEEEEKNGEEVKKGGEEMGEEAKKVVKDAIDEILSALSSEKKSIKKDPKKVREIVDKYFVPHFDVPYMSKFIVGKEQGGKEEVIQAIRDRMIRTYTPAIQKYEAQKIEVLPVKKEHVNAAKKKVIIRSKLKDQGSEYLIKYYLHIVDGEWKVWDISIEGVRLTMSFRDQFGDYFKKYNFEDALEKIKVAPPPTSSTSAEKQ